MNPKIFAHIGKHHINLNNIDLVTESEDADGKLLLCISFVSDAESVLWLYGDKAKSLKRILDAHSVYAVVPFSAAEDNNA